MDTLSGGLLPLSAANAVAGYLALQWLGRGYGATRTERHRLLPGDDLIAAP